MIFWSGYIDNEKAFIQTSPQKISELQQNVMIKAIQIGLKKMENKIIQID